MCSPAKCKEQYSGTYLQTPGAIRDSRARHNGHFGLHHIGCHVACYRGQYDNLYAGALTSCCILCMCCSPALHGHATPVARLAEVVAAGACSNERRMSVDKPGLRMLKPHIRCCIYIRRVQAIVGNFTAKKLHCVKPGTLCVAGAAHRQLGCAASSSRWRTQNQPSTAVRMKPRHP